MFFWRNDRELLTHIDKMLHQLLERDPTTETGRWEQLMATMDDVRAADAAFDAALQEVVSVVDGLRADIANLTAQIAAGVDPAALQEVVDTLNTNTAELRQRLAPSEPVPEPAPPSEPPA